MLSLNRIALSGALWRTLLGFLLLTTGWAEVRRGAHAADMDSDNTLTLSSAPNPSTFGQTVTVTVDVSTASATGIVTFYDGSQILGTAPLNAGQATLAASLLSPGDHFLKAQYGGDFNNVAVSSAPLKHTVQGVPAAGFGTKTDYSACANIAQIAMTDLNGDGFLDLVGAVGNSAICVLLGQASGEFAPAAMYEAGSGSVVVSDFNLDGVPDLAVSEANIVKVLPGRGDGTFLPGLNTTAQGIPVKLVGGDFNADGIPDLAFPNYQNQSVSVLLGNGDGTFQTGNIFPVTANIASAIVTGDFNGDGCADLAVADYYGASVSILLGRGDGTFQPKIDFPLGLEYAVLLSAGDFDGDGRTDLAVAGSFGQNHLIRVLLGKGDGSFQAAQDIALNTNLWRMEVGDVDGDGHLDLIGTRFYERTGFLCMLGKGDGSFQAPVLHSSGTSFVGIAIADFNGDGRADLVLGQYLDPFVSIVMGLDPSVNLNAPGVSIAQSGGAGQAMVSASTGWTASSTAPWIHVTSGASGSGNGVVAYSVDANGGGNRTGTLTIGDRTFTISQAGLAAAAFRNTSNAIELTRLGVASLDHAWGGFDGDPSLAVDSGTGNLLAVGRDSYGALWANIFDASTQRWGEWSGGQGKIQGNPAVAAVGATGYVAVRDQWKAIWLTSYSGGTTFGVWTPLGGVFSTDPVAASCPDGSVYIVGKDDWNALWSGHYFPGSGFQGWQFGGGVVQGKPSIACGSDNGLYIGVRDNWNGVWMTRLQGNSWGGWYFGGGVVSADPLVAAGAGSIYAVVLDGSGAAYYRTFQEGTGNGWQAWGTIGGGFLDVAPAAVGGELYMAGRDLGNSLWWYRLAGNEWTRVGATGLAAGPLETAR